jgi:general secretion pathway protein H
MQNSENGFTLIEILVVLLIISITMGFALLAFGDFGEKRRVIVFSEQFANQIKLIQQQAILEHSTFGIQLQEHGYQVVRFHPPNQWKPVHHNHLFQHRCFPENLTIHWQKQALNPAALIIVYPSGDMTSFKLDFGTTKQPVIKTIFGQTNGDISIRESR